MEPIKKMNINAWKCLEYELANPWITNDELASIIGISVDSVRRYHLSPCYKEEMGKALRTRWADSQNKAQKSLLAILDDPEAKNKDKIEVAKFLLQGCGEGLDGDFYSNTQKVNISADDEIVINIVGDNLED